MSRATWTPEPDWTVQRSRCWAVTRAGCAPAAESLSKAADQALSQPRTPSASVTMSGSARAKLFKLCAVVVVVSDQVIHRTLHGQLLTSVPDAEVTIPLPWVNCP